MTPESAAVAACELRDKAATFGAAVTDAGIDAVARLRKIVNDPHSETVLAVEAARVLHSMLSLAAATRAFA